MLKPLLGEAEAIVPGIGDDGADLTLQLKLGNPEWVLVERQLGTSYLDVISALVTAEISGRSASLGDTRAVLWAATRRHHAEELTLEDCGELVTQFGGSVLGPLGEAIRGSIKMKEPDQGEAKPARTPATKKGGIGTES
jgi:hypothetical protein